MERRLLRSSDRRVAGVCGGLAQFFGLDPTGTRVAWILLTLFTAAFPGVLLYIVMWVLVPNEYDVP